jgi:hypothetical protein
MGTSGQRMDGDVTMPRRKKAAPENDTKRIAEHNDPNHWSNLGEGAEADAGQSIYDDGFRAGYSVGETAGRNAAVAKVRALLVDIEPIAGGDGKISPILDAQLGLIRAGLNVVFPE